MRHPLRGEATPCTWGEVDRADTGDNGPISNREEALGDVGPGDMGGPGENVGVCKGMPGMYSVV